MLLNVSTNIANKGKTYCTQTTHEMAKVRIDKMAQTTKQR